MRVADKGSTGRSRVRSRTVVALDLTLIAALLALLPQTFEFGEDSRRFPLVTISVMIGLLLLDLLIEVVPAARRRLAFLEAEMVPVPDEVATVQEILHDQEEEQDHQARQERDLRRFTPWSALVWLLAAGFGMFYVGYLLFTPIFLAVFFLWAKVPLKVAVGITLTVSLIFYFTFYRYLGMR